MTEPVDARSAETLKQCVAYVVRDCDEAGFHDAAYFLRRAMEELDKACCAAHTAVKTQAAGR